MPVSLPESAELIRTGTEQSSRRVSRGAVDPSEIFASEKRGADLAGFIVDDDGGGLEEWKDGEGEGRHDVDGAADGADVAELQLLLVAPAQPRELDVVEPAEKELYNLTVRSPQ